jgi:hypothetical protein
MVCIVTPIVKTPSRYIANGLFRGTTAHGWRTARKDASVVRYSLFHENEQLFASKYKLVLPSEEELRAELDRERALLAEQSRASG